MSNYKYPVDSIFPFKDDKKPIYPFAEMKVGDSFFRPVTIQREVKTVYSNVTSWRKRGHMEQRFRTKVLTVNGCRGVRVWRTA